MSDLVGIVPAGGMARRLSPLVGSKELIPIGFMDVDVNGRVERRPKPVCVYVIEAMKLAGANRLYVVVNREKTDIPQYLGDGSRFGTNLCYLIQENVWGMPFALNLAGRWIKDATVLFGMPDTLFAPQDVYRQLLSHHRVVRADVTLGLFRTNVPHQFGMVAFDEARKLLYTIDKPKESSLIYMWGIACWGSSFTDFMSKYMANCGTPSQEVVLGGIFQAAHNSGLVVSVLPFDQGEYIDIGTPEGLVAAIQRFATVD